MRIPLPLALLTCTLLASCATAPPAPPVDDPLPRLFPIRLANEPAAVGGFRLLEQRRDPDPYRGWWLLYQGGGAPSQQLQVRIWLDGAFVDAMQALDSQQSRAEQQLVDWLRNTGDALGETTSRRLWQVAGRQGRRLVFGTRSGGSAALDSFFVDPWAVTVYGSQLPPGFTEAGGGMDQFSAALVASLQPDPAVLCGTAVELVPVNAPLSNVSSNGRIVFFSAYADNNDRSTRDELLRMAALKREANGCPPDGLDHDAVRKRLDRAARNRAPRRP